MIISYEIARLLASIESYVKMEQENSESACLAVNIGCADYASIKYKNNEEVHKAISQWHELMAQVRQRLDLEEDRQVGK